MSVKVMLPDLRIGFPALWTPQSFGEGKPAYGGKAIVQPANKKITKILDDAMLEAAKGQPKWTNPEKVLAKLVADDAVCFRKKEYCDKNGDPYAGFEDAYYLSLRSEKTKPLVLDRDKSPLEENSGKPYSGAFCNLHVEIWAQDNKFGRRINATLLGIQFFRDGDSFGGGSRPDADAFDDLSDGTEDGDDEDFG